jgi:hypothetical protein
MLCCPGFSRVANGRFAELKARFLDPHASDHFELRYDNFALFNCPLRFGFGDCDKMEQGQFVLLESAGLLFYFSGIRIRARGEVVLFSLA